MTTDLEAAPPPPVPEESKDSWQRLGGVLFSPDETFRDIARRPNVLLPLAILFIVSVISAVLLIPRIDFESTVRDQMERSSRAASMSPGDMDRAVRMGAALGKAIGYASPVVAIAIWAIIAGVMLTAFRLFGGEGTYKQAFSATLYAWIPLLIKSIVTTAVAMTKSTIDAEQIATLVTSNPAFLLDLKVHPIAFSLLSSIDIFAIWTIVLFIIGFAHLSKVSKAKSATIVISLWAVMIIVKLGFAALGAARMKAAS
ncbi:MAG TPA: Yip1 family protein [Thermoanaerobaculia bacterium]|nr:Yip1 family protein [Thermoanaerobaculia bacterium]